MGENQLYLLSYSKVEREDASSWSWFFGKFHEIFNINSSSTVICSDRDKSLLHADNRIALLYYLSSCSGHIFKISLISSNISESLTILDLC